MSDEILERTKARYSLTLGKYLAYLKDTIGTANFDSEVETDLANDLGAKMLNWIKLIPEAIKEASPNASKYFVYNKTVGVFYDEMKLKAKILGYENKVDEVMTVLGCRLKHGNLLNAIKAGEQLKTSNADVLLKIYTEVDASFYALAKARYSLAAEFLRASKVRRVTKTEWKKVMEDFYPAIVENLQSEYTGKWYESPAPLPWTLQAVPM